MDWRQGLNLGKQGGNVRCLGALGVVPFVSSCLLYDGRTPWKRRGSFRVDSNWPSPGGTALPLHGGRFVRRHPAYLLGARHLLVGRLESLHEVLSGRWWSTNSRSPGVGKVPELPGPFFSRKLGSDGLDRVRRGAFVRIPINSRRVARPHNGAERDVCSGHRQLATNFLPGAGEVPDGSRALRVPGLRNSSWRG